jgi:hypothetical protein
MIANLNIQDVNIVNVINIIVGIMAIIFMKFYIFEKDKKEKDVNTWYEITLENARYKYKGEWLNGLPHGKGIKEVFGIDDNKYSIIIGNFKNGVTDGYAIQIFDQDDDEIMVPHYKGNFKKGRYNGHGEYHWGTGSYYKGEFKKDEFHGNGLQYFVLSDKYYIGSYENGKRINGQYIQGKPDNM